MKNELEVKSKKLRLAIEKYNLIFSFVEKYKSSKCLDEYIEYISSMCKTLSDDTANKYKQLIDLYNNGNIDPLLQDLYNRLLSAHDYKVKITNELTTLLRK